MSMVPFISEFYGFNDEPLLEDSFGLGIYPVDIFRPSHRRCYPYKRQSPSHGKIGGWQKCSNDGLQVSIDVIQFTPNELTVKTLDNTVVVEGKHKEHKDESGTIQRHFVRKYTLPQGYEEKDVVATISSDDILTVKALPPPNKVAKNERFIQIQQTGPAYLNVKQPKVIKNIELEIANGEAEKMETK